jgi:hypothetical protein
MDIPPFIVPLGVAIALIAVAIDIPTTQWMFRYSAKTRKMTLIQIMQRASGLTQDNPEEDITDGETISQKEAAAAATYKRAKKIGQKEGTW